MKTKADRDALVVWKLGEYIEELEEGAKLHTPVPGVAMMAGIKLVFSAKRSGKVFETISQAVAERLREILAPQFELVPGCPEGPHTGVDCSTVPVSGIGETEEITDIKIDGKRPVIGTAYAPPEWVECPDCGTQVKRVLQYCGKCGTEIASRFATGTVPGGLTEGIEAMGKFAGAGGQRRTREAVVCDQVRMKKLDRECARLRSDYCKVVVTLRALFKWAKSFYNPMIYPYPAPVEHTRLFLDGLDDEEGV